MDLFLNDIKSHFKLDFIDKIIISIVFVIGAILCPFYVFADEIETVTPTNIRLGFGTYSLGNYGEFVEGNANLGYFLVEPGYHYTIYNNSQSNSLLVSSTDTPSVGVEFYADRVIAKNSQYDFNSSSYKYLYLTQSYNLTVSRVKLEGMSDVIDNLYFNVGFNNIWDIFNIIIPYIVIVVLVCIGLLFIRRLAMFLSKGKSRI